MTRAALTHVYPYWAPPLNDPYAPQEEWSEQVVGRMRIVRNRRRARLLKCRGVPMWFNSHERCWMWFIELPEVKDDA